MADQIAQITQLDPDILESLPTIQPPDGVQVDFNGPHPRQKTEIVATTVFITAMLVLVGIRAWTKLRKLCKTSWDDGKYL